MPFDAELVLIDGTIDLSPTTDTAPTSTTRDATTGAAVVDLKETGVKGLACVLVLPAANAAGDIMTGLLESSDEEDFASDVHELGKFDIAAATKGIILGSETPAVAVFRFATTERYVRANITITAGDDFKKVQVLLSPYPFKVL